MQHEETFVVQVHKIANQRIKQTSEGLQPNSLKRIKYHKNIDNWKQLVIKPNLSEIVEVDREFVNGENQYFNK